MRGSISTRAVLPAACLAAVWSSATFGQCTLHNGSSCNTQGGADCPGNPAYPPSVCCKPVGPDVIVGDLQSVANFTASATIDVFSFGTTSCNLGSANISWNSNTNAHPVVGQNMFKMKTSGGYTRFEQLGQSFLKHTFEALLENACGCGGCNQGNTVLGVGCSDPYTAGRNANQNLATATSFGGCGPKNQVNAANGNYVFPPTAPAASGTVTRRLQCKLSDLEASSGTVRYFGECQYVTADDAISGNKNN